MITPTFHCLKWLPLITVVTGALVLGHGQPAPATIIHIDDCFSNSWWFIFQFLLRSSLLHLIHIIHLGPDHVQMFWKHKCFGNISQLETRPLIGWPSESTNQRPGFQLTYVSKTLSHDPVLLVDVIENNINICLKNVFQKPKIIMENAFCSCKKHVIHTMELDNYMM